ncbi:MAG: PH domain-containing protein [Planctomycetes bacterium]|nr:PH domain-containing protein [Planctomycetota bacterium]MCB9887910.1 PH domain-containing protein [Planctomycetota bacterium]
MDAAPPPVPTDRLQARVVGYWVISDGLGALFLGALLWFVARPLLQEHWTGWSQTYENLLLGACLGFAALALLLPPLTYARWRYGFLGDLLLLRYGILFVEERAVPVRRMQHVDLLRGPIERLFGLATLIVFTAGNEGSAFRVPGLSLARAQELRDRIVQMRGDGRL